jgi:hypothetical protein
MPNAIFSALAAARPLHATFRLAVQNAPFLLESMGPSPFLALAIPLSVGAPPVEKWSLGVAHSPHQISTCARGIVQRI